MKKQECVSPLLPVIPDALRLCKVIMCLYSRYCIYRLPLFIFFLLTTFLSDIGALQTEENPFTVQPPDSSILLEEVAVEAYQVSGPLRTIPGSLSVLTGDGLSQADATNLATTLNTVPGVTMQSGTYATNRIVIRGMGSRTPYNTNRIRSYLNDIPLTSSDGVSTPEEIDLLGLGRMEVIKGPASALYGSGLGGSLNLYSPVKSRNEGNLNVQYGSYDTRKANLSGTLNGENSNLWGSISHLQSDGYRENNHFRRTSLLSAGQWRRSRWSVNATLLLMDVDGGIPSSLGITLFEQDPQAAAPNWKAIEGYQKYRKGLAGITLTGSLGEWITNRLTVSGRWNDNAEKRPFNNLHDQSLSAGIRNKLILYTAKADWVLGAEWISEQYEWKLDIDQTLLNKNRENRNLFGLFVMIYYRPVAKLNLSMAGALNFTSYRLTDLFNTNGNQSGKRNFPPVFSPRIGANYTPGHRLALYASAGHGYSLPSPEETLLPEGEVNPGIRPEQGWQFEAGSRLTISANTVELDGTLYWIELNNLLITKRLTEDIFIGMNAGRTRHQGFELLLRSRILERPAFPGSLKTIFSYTGSLNRFIKFTDDTITYDGKYLPGIPDHSLQLKLTWKPFHWLETIADMQYSGKQFLDDGNSLKYPGHILSNLRMKTNFRVKNAGMFSIYAGINNITGTRYASMLIVNATAFDASEPRYYYPGLPRHMYAGLHYRF